jgi:NADH-quinone oxidoreductase subunit N
MWFYVATYAVQVLAAFAVASVVSGPATGRSPLTDYAGLSARSPFLAAMLALMMLAMGGIPVTAGFVGKVAVFRSAIDAGYLWLVITGVVATVAGLFFYLRVIVLMYMQPAADAPESPAVRLSVPMGTGIVLAVAALVTLLAGLVPWPLLEWLRDALPL